MLSESHDHRPALHLVLFHSETIIRSARRLRNDLSNIRAWLKFDP